MKMLHFADLHLAGPKACEGNGASGVDSRRDALRRIVDLALDLSVDALTVGGDLYEHEHATAETGDFIATQFKRLGSRRVLIAPGNHDPHVAGSLYERTAWPSNVEIFRDTRWRPVTLAPDVQVWGIGHDRPVLQENLLRRLHLGPAGTNIALFHGWDMDAGPARGVLHCPFTEDDVKRSEVDFALVGHYHNMSILPHEQPRYGYPGVPLAIDSTDQTGHVLLLSIERSRVSVEAIKLGPDVTRQFAIPASRELAGTSVSSSRQRVALGRAQ
jgi:DNA repair exonuclease SbcCD nuclease subunit